MMNGASVLRALERVVTLLADDHDAAPMLAPPPTSRSGWTSDDKAQSISS